MKVEFIPEYYEWNVLVDGDVFYTFGDIVEDIPYPLTKDNCEIFAENLVGMMEVDLQTREKIVEYDPFIPILLLESIKTEIWNRYAEVA